MPQVYKVSGAFLSTVSKEDKTPQVVNTPGGDMHKYMVQVENQPVQGWFSVLKKPGNEVKKGDELYGDITENNWGKPQFTRAQRPQEGTQVYRPQQQSNGGSELEAKVDYLISLVENFLESKSGSSAQKTNVDTQDDEPVDLTSLDY